MTCSFCHRSESEINEIFIPIISSFEKEIFELNTLIEDTKKQFTIKHGFTKENFEKVMTINENILAIKLNAIINNLIPFLRIDSNIEILISYFNKYQPQISLDSTLKYLLDLFIEEPTQTRLDNEVRETVFQRDNLIKEIDTIKNKNKFIQMININDIIIPLKVFKFEKYLESTIVKIIRGSSQKRTITLCPYCSYLFNNKNDIQSFDSEMTQTKERYVLHNLRQNNVFREPNPLEE
ncbi:MAG: hypothetical protein LBB61_03425 [Treponema sp.]|jgi:hypothetical protein|nr:hypothetical protein [Treponema sp.]